MADRAQWEDVGSPRTVVLVEVEVNNQVRDDNTIGGNRRDDKAANRTIHSDSGSGVHSYFQRFSGSASQQFSNVDSTHRRQAGAERSQHSIAIMAG
jgi:hypothetical protein